MADFSSVILDHINVGVADIDRSRAFYVAALAPLGLACFFDIPAGRSHSGARLAGFGRTNDRPVLWLVDGQSPGGELHVALQASTREDVDAFHRAALAAGGRDNGAPGVRWYHPNYYGAFVIDPDGINLEAVCHLPSTGA